MYEVCFETVVVAVRLTKRLTMGRRTRCTVVGSLGGFRPVRTFRPLGAESGRDRDGPPAAANGLNRRVREHVRIRWSGPVRQS